MCGVNPSRVAAWIVALAVLGAWLASAAGVSRGSYGTRAPAAVAPNPVDHLASDVQAQAGRLRQRLDGAPAPQTPIRNPFAFLPRTENVSRPRTVTAAALVPPVPVEPPEPSFELVGIAENKTGEVVVRTAVMSDRSGDVIMATAGQRVLGTYEVVAIGHDAIELKHVATGATRRLVLR
jgi:hypothetical protein